MMKKIISAVLTVTMIMGATSVAFAQPKDKASKPAPAIVTTKVDAKTCATQKKEDEKKPEIKKPEIKEQDKKNEDKKNEVKKDSQLDKSKQSLIKTCDDMIAQITKLKGYIISKEGKFLVEFKDQATGDAVLKSIDEAINKINEFKKRIEAATDSKVLKDLKKEIENNFLKHQTIVKRITGLTSAARLKTAYDETKALVDKLGAGINAINITTGSSIKLDVEALKKQHAKIQAELEEARLDYLDAVAMFSSMTDSTKADKNFKAAHDKLMEAKDGLHDVLIETKQLLVKIKTGVHKEIGAIKIDVDDDDDDDKDHDYDKDHDDEDDD